MACVNRVSLLTSACTDHSDRKATEEAAHQSVTWILFERPKQKTRSSSAKSGLKILPF